jgi:hypothetical protein
MSSIYLYEVGRLEEPKDKRRTRRVSVSPPLRVRGVNAHGVKFEEVTRSPDVSSDGALFILKQPLSKGMRLGPFTGFAPLRAENRSLEARLRDSGHSGAGRTRQRERDISGGCEVSQCLCQAVSCRGLLLGGTFSSFLPGTAQV